MRQPEEKNFSSDVGSEGLPTDTFHLVIIITFLEEAASGPAARSEGWSVFKMCSEILGQIFL